MDKIQHIFEQLYFYAKISQKNDYKKALENHFYTCYTVSIEIKVCQFLYPIQASGLVKFNSAQAGKKLL